MAKDIKNPETIALHGGEFRSAPATTALPGFGNLVISIIS